MVVSARRLPPDSIEPEWRPGVTYDPMAIQVPPHYRLGLSGWYDPHRAGLLYTHRKTDPTRHAQILGWLRDHVHPEIPRWYYEAVLGHDLHLSVWAELYVRHHHRNYDWWEDIGRVSRGKVTTAFRDFEAANLVTDTTAYGDFKFHEVGLGATAEANTQTALTTTSGIARTSGNQTNPSAFSYQTVGVTTADTTETWQEQGVFNAASGGVMLDRSVLAPTISVQPGDTVEWTYILTKSAEA